jgi:signal transduction histidine kinase
MLKRLQNRFLLRLAAPADVAERLRVERVLAAARIFLTLAALVAVYLDPTEPNRYAELAYVILVSYCIWGITVWFLVQRSDEISSLRSWIHFLDVVFPMSFILFTAGPNSPFFVFLLFVLVAAAFRWGLPETMLTSCVVTGLLIIEAAVLSYEPLHGWVVGQYEVNRFIIRISYLLTLGMLVGYLGEEEKQWRAEQSTVTRLLSRVHAENGLRASMQQILLESTRIFRASRALVVLTQSGTDRMFLWRLQGTEAVAHDSEVEPGARARFQFTLPAPALFALKQSRGWKCWAINNEGRKLKLPTTFDATTIAESNGSGSVLGVSVQIGEEWSGNLLLFDAVMGTDPAAELRFIHNLMRQIGPALYTVFLVRRLRSRAGAIERARVARELHDGAIQALISVEMQLDVVRRQVESPEHASTVAAGLERVQELLRQQVFELRMLMQQMRPMEFRPGQLLDYMADMVDRFRRDTGIGARFVTSLEDVQVSSRVARELARILQEALVNIRKHSHANSVQVRFAAEDGCWRLEIVDNGRGFDFSGTLDLQKLDAGRLGPAIIKERVRGLGGGLTLSSNPTGSELIISLPQKAHSTYV